MDFRKNNINTDLPLVTIGVLSYNYSMYIVDALNSLLTQTYPNIELIIIDDCSTDDCPALIESWIKENDINCTFVKHDRNQGITKTSNEIVKLSKGRYLNLFATDDIMMPEKIERQVELLEKAGEEYGMSYANVETMNEEGSRKGYFINEEITSFYEGDILEQYLNKQLVFATPSSLIRTSVYKKIGCYDERMLYEDYNFWLRLFACYKVKFCEYPCLVYRIKTVSPIFEQWTKNNKERYYSDRILSNHQGLKFIDDARIKTKLKNKISQYLKMLAAHRSSYYPGLIQYLMRKGYFRIPPKTIFIYIFKR